VRRVLSLRILIIHLFCNPLIKIRKFIYGVDDGDNFNFRAVDMEMVSNALLLIDWSFLESYEDVDLACRGFYNKLFELFDLILPKKRKSRHNYPPWFWYELIKKIKLKHRMLKKFRVSGKLCDLEKFRMLRRDIKGDIKRQYDQYVAKVEADIKRDPNKISSGSSSNSNRTVLVFLLI
jgi:hypothetical protein